MSDETRIHDIIVRHLDAATREAQAGGLKVEQFAAQGISYLIGGLVLGSPRWSPDRVAMTAKACAEGYAAKLKPSH